MAIPDKTKAIPESGSDVESADVATPEMDESAELEPLTPERALEWNRYYDKYVVGGAILLVFLVSAHKIANSNLWPLLKTGEVIVRNGAPVTTDIFSYTEAGKPWVNVPWLYEVASHGLYQFGKTTFTGDASVGEQIGAGILVTLNALARVLTVVFLLRLRRPGPGLWWSALVAVLALGCIPAPRLDSWEFSVGGLARQAPIAPEAWGVLLLAVEVFLLDRAFGLGKKNALMAIPPLFLLWANVDESFAFGLVVLWAVVIGSLLDRREPARWKPSPAMAALVLIGSPALCLLNPSHVRIFGAAFGPFLEIPGVVFGKADSLPNADQVAFFGAKSWLYVEASPAGPLGARLRVAFYALVVFAGLASFGLDRRRLNLGRLLAYLAAAVLWAGLSRLSGEFAIVWAYVIALNGQEWYQSRYGLTGRITPGWTAWSIGGRALTILAFFLVMAKTLTGYNYIIMGQPGGRPTFGFGVDESAYDFEAADYLRTSKINGQVINLDPSEGDALIWRAYPVRKTFWDGRRGVFSAEVQDDLSEFRRAFFPGDDPTQIVVREDPARWRKVLDKYKATAVMFSPKDNPRLFGAMRESTNWIPIRDDGRTVLFGRADADKADLATFQANKLDADQIVYHRKQSLPFPDRTPSAMTIIDRVIRTRALAPAQPHVAAANRWLDSGVTTENGGLPDAAHCIMAIREARIAIHYNPDESDAYRILDVAYEFLTRNELSTMPDRTPRALMEYLNYRTRQRITALNYAIQTTPPPRDLDEKRDLAQVYFRLALVYRRNGDIDLERDALASARDLVPADEFSSEEFRRLEQLDAAIARFKEDLQQLATNGADPQQRASRAMSAGFSGIAQHELEEAETQGVSTDQLLGPLVNLYCRTGQPEKASERLSGRQVDDPALYTGPGTPAYLHGLVNLLLGFYDVTVSQWRDRALVQIRQSEASQGLVAARELLMGRPLEATNTTLELAGQPNQPGLIEIDAQWEFELALCLLESGDPVEAGRHFSRALLLNPQISTHALIEDYLKKLGVTPPAAAKGEGEAAKSEGEAKPAEAKSEAPKGEGKVEEAKPEAKPDTPKPDAKPDAPKR